MYSKDINRNLKNFKSLIGKGTYRRCSKMINSRMMIVGPILAAILDGGPSYAHPVRDGGILSSPRRRLLFFARFAHFKRVEYDPSCPGLHTPSTRTEGPLVRDDAEAFSLPISLTLSVRLSLSFPVFFGPSPTLLAAVPVISSLARVEDSTSPRAPALLL